MRFARSLALLIPILTFVLTFVLMTAPSINASAANSGITYQGRILKPDGSPLSGTDTYFRIQLRSPDSNNCLLYEEIQRIDMHASNGQFALTMNDGGSNSVRTSVLVNDNGAGFALPNLDRLFQNRGTFTFNPADCTTGSSYAPNSSDGRKLVVEFKDETMATYEPIPSQTVNYVPFAFESKSVAGFPGDSLLRVQGAGGAGTVASISPLSNADYTKLIDLINGSSASYERPGYLGGVAIPSTGSLTAGQVLSWNGSAWAASTPGGAGSVGTAAIVNQAVTATKLSPAAAGTAGQLLSLDGSGNLVWSNAPNTSQWTTQAPGINYMSGNVGIGTTSPDAALQINRNVSPAVAPNSGSNLHITGIDNSSNALTMDAYGSNKYWANYLTLRRAQGTAAAPSYPVAQDYLSSLQMQGWTGSTFGGGSHVTGYANETWTSTAQGSGLYFGVTPNGGTAGLNMMTVTGDSVTIGGPRSLQTWATAGRNLNILAGVLTDTNGAPTVATKVASSIAAPTFASSTAQTVTNAANVYIAGAPIAGANTTITNAQALHVASGLSYFGGNVGIGTTAPSALLSVAGLATLGPTTTAGGNTTLSAGITTSQTTIPVASTAGFPNSGKIFVLAGSGEVMTYDSKDATNFFGVTRAVDGTVVQTGLSGALVSSYLLTSNTYNSQGSRVFLTSDGLLSLGQSQYRGGSTLTAGPALMVGVNTNANQWSIAAGNGSIASGLSSLAVGNSVGASGSYSHALGNAVAVSGSAATGLGESLTVSSYASTAVGRYNTGGGSSFSWVATDPLFEVGNGTGTGASASDAMMILKNGNVGIGTTAPSAKLQIAAGSTTLAPFKLTSSGSGVLLATAQDGAMEYDGTDLWFTIGTTRYVMPRNSAAGNYSNVTTISNSSGSIVMAPMAGSGSVQINSGTASLGSTSGALIVTGGAGISGVLNVGSNINATGDVTASGNLATRGGNALILNNTVNDATSSIKNTGATGIANMQFLTGASTRMTIDSTGYVGIGTTSPASALDVVGSLNASGSINTPSSMQAMQYGFYNGNFKGSIDSIASGGTGGALRFFTRTASNTQTEKMRIDDAGYVGIGTTSPTRALDVVGQIGATSGVSGTNFASITTGPSSTVTSSYASASAADEKYWDWYRDTTSINLRALNDSYAASNTAINVKRSGYTISNVNFPNGNVGIGTTAPVSKLDVAGGIHATQNSTFDLDIAFGATIFGPNALLTTGGNNVYSGTSSSVATPAGRRLSIQNGWFVDNNYAGMGFESANSSGISQSAYLGAYTVAGASSYTPVVVLGQKTGATSYTERLRIDAAGNVGIGTTAPSFQLDNVGTTHSSGNLYVGTTGTAGQMFLARSSDGSYNYSIGLLTGQEARSTNSSAVGYYTWYTNNGATAERMRIDNNGNVGIGTTSPVATLDVNGFIKMKKNSAAPATCDATTDGSIAMTATRTLCVCDSTSWKQLTSPASACVWP